jgi:hypothetical protein
MFGIKHSSREDPFSKNIPPGYLRSGRMRSGDHRHPISVGVSAPTALAVRACDAAGITLIAVARQDGFEVFTHPNRVTGDSVAPALRSTVGSRADRSKIYRIGLPPVTAMVAPET